MGQKLWMQTLLRRSRSLKEHSKVTGLPVDRSLPGFEAAKFAGAALPPLAVIAAGSDSDMPHLEKLQTELAAFKIESEIRICSAHKQPGRLQTIIAEYSTYPGPVMMVGCA